MLTSDKAFARSGEILDNLLGVKLASETVRCISEAYAARITAWQKSESASEKTFAKVEGEFEFAIDAGKVNTLENGWRDLKIVVAQKRPLAATATPEHWQTRELPAATARVMWADIATASTFRRHWAPRLKRLGLKAAANLHVIGDGASWIWKSADRALTGCRQTLDIYHALENIADAGKKLFGEGTPEMTTFFERGRELLVSEGWQGVCRLVGEQYQREPQPSERPILPEAVEALPCDVAILPSGGRGADEQSRGADVAAWCDVAEDQFRESERDRSEIYRADSDGGSDGALAGAFTH